MKIETLPFADAIPADLMADAQAVIDSLTTGKSLDPEIAKRVRERSEKIREDVFLRYGVLDIGTPAIRELRGELPA